MNRFFFLNELKTKHGTPDSEKSLKKYLDLVLSATNEDTKKYSENHHILSKSLFPEFQEEKWNIVKLNYENHILAHIYLFESFNLRSYHRTLNFMIPQKYKNSIALSKAAKRGWTKLKSDTKKYEKWVESRRSYMKSLTSKEQSRRSKLGWDSLTDEEYKERCEKNTWDEETRKKLSESLKEFHEQNPNFASCVSKKRWKEMPESERKKFSETMEKVNKDLNKRKRAGKAIKEKWKNDTDFKRKMENRNRRTDEYKLVSPEGKVFYRSGWRPLLEEFNFNSSLIRKFLDTDKKVEEPKKQKNRQQNKNTIGWKFYKKK